MDRKFFIAVGRVESHPAVKALKSYLEGYTVGTWENGLRISRKDTGKITKLEAGALSDAVCQVFGDHNVAFSVLRYWVE
ncbi:MAG: hypothetical protein GWN58_26385 [Anaerolineae bacterium]|nr:hypothetical protein [Anaerolineae bacterium]